MSLDADEKDRERKRVDLEREEAEIQRQLAHQQRHEKQQRLKDELHQQIVELTQRETRQNQLKNEERELMIEQGELHHERQLQIAKEKKEKQRSYQKILYRQYRAQILRRAHEIERELEEDLAVLERVALESRRDENDQSARWLTYLEFQPNHETDASARDNMRAMRCWLHARSWRRSAIVRKR